MEQVVQYHTGLKFEQLIFTTGLQIELGDIERASPIFKKKKILKFTSFSVQKSQTIKHTHIVRLSIAIKEHLCNDVSPETCNLSRYNRITIIINNNNKPHYSTVILMRNKSVDANVMMRVIFSEYACFNVYIILDQFLSCTKYFTAHYA